MFTAGHGTSGCEAEAEDLMLKASLDCGGMPGPLGFHREPLSQITQRKMHLPTKENPLTGSITKWPFCLHVFLLYCLYSRNQLSALPACLCGLPLKVLIASNNKLGSLPEEIGQLKQLMELVCY